VDPHLLDVIQALLPRPSEAKNRVISAISSGLPAASAGSRGAYVSFLAHLARDVSPTEAGAAFTFVEG
jgi:hypothetical protein